MKTSDRPKINWIGVRLDGHGGLERIEHASGLNQKRDGIIGWDATCECGWHSNGGATIKARTTEEVEYHVWFDHGIKPSWVRRATGESAS